MVLNDSSMILNGALCMAYVDPYQPYRTGFRVPPRSILVQQTFSIRSWKMKTDNIFPARFFPDAC